METLPVWRLSLQCLAVGDSSNKCDENTQVLQGRQGSKLAEDTESVSGHPFLDLHVLSDANVLGDRQASDQVLFYPFIIVCNVMLVEGKGGYYVSHLRGIFSPPDDTSELRAASVSLDRAH